MDLITVAQAAVAVLAPLLPYLTKGGEEARFLGKFCPCDRDHRRGGLRPPPTKRPTFLETV